MTCPLVHFIVCMSFDYTLLSSIRPLRGRITLYNYCATTTTTTLTREQVELPASNKPSVFNARKANRLMRRRIDGWEREEVEMSWGACLGLI